MDGVFILNGRSDVTALEKVIQEVEKKLDNPSVKLVLLDEISAHLDASRRAALFEELLQFDSQAWLTGTDTALFAPLRSHAQFLSVHDGTLSPTSL